MPQRPQSTRQRLRRAALAASAATLLLPVAAAPAQADPAFRLEARVNHDGNWAVTGETLGGPADGRVELWRGGAMVPGATASSGPDDPTGFAQLRQDRDPDDGPGGLADDVVLAAGDELRYFTDGVLAATATYAGRPAIDGACTGATSFTAGVDAGVGSAAGGAAAGTGTARDGSATISGTTATVALDGPLTAGSIAWAETTATLPGATAGDGDDVLLILRAERAAALCVLPAAAGTGTSPLAVLGDGRADPAPAPAVAAPRAPAATPPDRTPPTARLEVPRPRIRALARDGFAFAVACGEPCAATGALTLDRRTAEKLRIVKRGAGRDAVSLGSGSATVGVGRGVVAVPVKRSTLKRLRRARRVTLTLYVRVTDAAGNSSAAVSSLRLKR
jgi:hypothetical protein